MEDELPLEEPRGPSRWPRMVTVALGGLLILTIVAYFVVSSTAFLKGVILPRLGKSLHAEITVGDVSLSPFSRLTLTQLKVQTTGPDPLVTAEKVEVRYSLLAILRGNYVIHELSLASPTIRLVTESTGASNLDPITKGAEEGSSASRSSGRLRLAIRNVSCKDGVVLLVDKAKDGSVRSSQFNQLDLTLDRLENGEPGKLSLTTGVRLEHQAAPGTAGTNDLAEGKLNGNLQFKLDAGLLPQTLTGTGRLDFSRAEGGYAELAGLSGALQAEMTPTEVRQVLLRFERRGQALGKFQVTGPLDLVKGEGRLRIELQSLDRQVLNLLGTSQGWDFVNSTISATNIVDLASQGGVIGAKGQIVGRQISVKREGESTPPVDVDIDYDVSFQRSDQTALVKTLTLSIRQQQTEIAHGSLDRPMTLAWAPNGRGLTESTFQLGLNRLSLGDWRSLCGTNVPTGQLGLQLTVYAKQDGRSLSAKGSATIDDLSLRLGTNQIQQAKATLSFDGLLEDFRRLTLKQYQLDLRQTDQPLVNLSGSGRCDLSTSDLSFQANAELALAPFLRQFPIAPVAASNGSLHVSSAYTKSNQQRTLTGNLFVAAFTGSYADYAFQDLGAGLDYSIVQQGAEVQVRTASLTLRKGYNVAGTLNLTGTSNLEKKSSQFTFRVLDLDQDALEPFLSPFLGDKKLVSLSLNSAGSVTYDPNGDSALKATLSVTNWVVADPRAQSASPALSAAAQLEGSMHQQAVELQQFLVKLPLTDKARSTNELQVKARVDLSRTNAVSGQITIQSGGLDATPYYDLFAGNKPTNTPAAASSAAPSSQQAKPVEPPPATLPLEQLSAEVKLDRFYLRDLAITNLLASANLNRSELTLKPVQLILNGGPVTASAVFNLGVAGYTYNLAMQADRVPLDPLVTSFSTNAPGQSTGDLIGQAQLKGAGITDPNLKKNLSGNLSITLTNMNYEIVGPKIKRLLEPISTVLSVPELMQTPLNWVSARAAVGNGQIDVQQFALQSQAFSAETHGTIPMADVLSNSPLSLPVNLSLRRSLAERAHLIAANTPTNTVYVELPSFVTLSGTLGDPKSEVKKLVAGGMLFRAIGSLPHVGGKAGAILQQLGGALTGQPATASSTNRPGTNAPVNPAKSDLLDLLKLIPEKK